MRYFFFFCFSVLVNVFYPPSHSSGRVVALSSCEETKNPQMLPSMKTKPNGQPGVFYLIKSLIYIRALLVQSMKWTLHVVNMCSCLKSALIRDMPWPWFVSIDQPCPRWFLRASAGRSHSLVFSVSSQCCAALVIFSWMQSSNRYGVLPTKPDNCPQTTLRGWSVTLLERGALLLQAPLVLALHSL